MIKHYAVLYIATLVIMVAMDMLWLKGIAQQFYKDKLGDLIEFRIAPAIVFYLIYVVGILVFASATGTGWKSVLLYSAFLGFLAYATYDLTNMATLRGWPLSLTLIDIAWGVFNTGLSGTVGWLAARFITR